MIETCKLNAIDPPAYLAKSSSASAPTSPAPSTTHALAYANPVPETALTLD